MYFIILIGFMILSFAVSRRLKNKFRKYSQIPLASGLSGSEVARAMLADNGIQDVEVISVEGHLTDHYNPANKTLALSEPVYGSHSIAAIGIACHEAGHAIQHAKHYAPLWLRSLLVPTAGFGSRFGYLVMFVGLIMSSMQIFAVGVILFAAVLLFQLVTLPVEFDASARAKRLATEYGLIQADESVGMNRVLNAAALTYVAAEVSSLLTLAYFLLRAGVLGGRD